MKTITIVAERVTDQAMTAIIPTSGVASVMVSPHRAGVGHTGESLEYQSFRSPSRFTPAVRIEVSVEDDVVDTVFDGVSFAYAAGIFSDAEMWVEAPALALSA